MKCYAKTYIVCLAVMAVVLLSAYRHYISYESKETNLNIFTLLDTPDDRLLIGGQYEVR